MAREFKILEGLPPYGPEALSFPQGQLLAREGLVVRFDMTNRLYWIGNFKRGKFDISKVLNHPDGQRLVVYAGGIVYFVDPEKKSVMQEFDTYVFFAEELLQFNTIVMGDSVKFFAIDANSVRWTTPRIGWGEFREVKLSGNNLMGEAFSPLDDKWHPFEVDIRTGDAKGDTYESQIAHLVPIVKKD